MNKKLSLEEFYSMPVKKAVISNVIPAMITMIMALIYNLADTFFIGQTHNDIMVAAISLSAPIFMLFTAFGTIFGVGGMSVISRSSGSGDMQRAKKTSSFCMWASILFGVVLALVFVLFADPLLYALGASEQTFPYAYTYLTIVAISGPFAMISGAFSKILMADGQPKRAMLGATMGNVINIILDPVFILLFGLDVGGAAIATVISNIFAAGYYILYFVQGKSSSLSISINDFSAKDRVLASVLSMGIPAALGPIVMGISQLFLNSMVATYGDMALAGIGVAVKFTMITGFACMGIGQGVSPLLGYCVGAKNWSRFNETMKFSLVFALILGVALTGICYIFTEQIAGVFLTEDDSLSFAIQFAKVLLLTSSLFGVFYVFQFSMQSMGAAFPALIINVSRQGIIYIPMIYILNLTFGLTGIVYAQPIADVVSLILAALLCLRSYRKIKGEGNIKIPHAYNGDSGVNSNVTRSY